MSAQSNVVLVVDDDSLVGRLISSAVSDLVTVMCCESVECAVKVLMLEEPLLVVLDLKLSDGDGDDLLDDLWASGYSQDVLILTADKGKAALQRLVHARDRLTVLTKDSGYEKKIRSEVLTRLKR